MKLKEVLALIVLGLAIGACAKSNTGTWTRPGAEQGDMKRVSASCRAQAQEYVGREINTRPGDLDIIRPQDSRAVSGVFTQIELKRVYQRVYDDCVRAAGYRREQR